MKEVASIDYARIRRRFPWVGLVNTGERDLSARYREIMAEARRDREITRRIGLIHCR